MERNGSFGSEDHNHGSSLSVAGVEDIQAGVGQAYIAVSALSNTLGWLGCAGVMIKKGELVDKWTEAKAFAGSKQEGRLMAIRWAMEKTVENNVEDFICLVDDKDLVFKLNNKNAFNCHYDITAVDIYDLVSRLISCKFVFDCNWVSECVDLAKMALEGKLNAASRDDGALVV
ncbi:ribonuclease H-like superfamily protein [Striga asiatica]|uniref:Ribonuclease H-like superfamily protein n=1 Tax=Striga asiatica TaxID=4170 RepID=A0A5A7Q6L0_STRAF|nr:ribonuclease H-like superfamily protein [Striga asiatica]